MKDELEILLKNHNFTQEEQGVFFDCMMRLSSVSRKTLFTAVKGFPDYLSIFRKFFVEKRAYIENPSSEKLEAIIKDEEKLIEEAIERVAKL